MGSNAAILGYQEREQSRGGGIARDGQGQCRLEERRGRYGALVGCQRRARGGSEAAARYRDDRRRFYRFCWWSDPAVVGRQGRARGGREAVAQYWKSRHRF